VGPGFRSTLPTLLERLGTEPLTLAHGDFRADNLMFAADGQPIVFDFQLTGTSTGAFDLAYFITQSLRADDAAEFERALFDRWKRGLLAGDVPSGDLDRMWDDYRVAALFCLVYPVVASRGMDLEDLRQQELANTMMQRMARAADDLDLADLLV
jgi:aminoglycoside phosphotransferase (APT) family kinase protein